MLLAALMQQQQGGGAGMGMGGPQMGAPGPQMPTPMQRGPSGGLMGGMGGMQPPQPPAPQASPLAGMMGNPQMMATLMAMRNRPSASPGPQVGPSAMPNNTGDFGAMSVDDLRKAGFGTQPGLMSWLSGFFGNGGTISG